jgi:hypothetical protein
VIAIAEDDLSFFDGRFPFPSFQCYDSQPPPGRRPPPSTRFQAEAGKRTLRKETATKSKFHLPRAEPRGYAAHMGDVTSPGDSDAH